MRVLRPAIPALLLLILPGVALAKGPTLEDLPTVRALQEEADRAIVERRVAAAAAARDPKMDRIRAYREGDTNIHGWAELTGILKDDKEEAKYRFNAAAAIRERFKDYDQTNPTIASVKKKIASDLISRLNDKDVQVRIWIHGIYKAFWQGQAQLIGFKPEDPNYKKRFNAWKDWRKFLRD